MLSVRARRLVVLLAALTALVLAGCAGVTTTSGPAGVGVQNRVRAFTPAAQLLAPPTTSQSSCSRPCFTASAVEIAPGFCVAAKAVPEIKAGVAGGETAGKAFPQSVRQAALDENPSTCVFCRMETDSPQVDHAIPRARGGDATIENAQTSCPHCNASKGARDNPVNPPPGYRGPWPPPWWRP